jgi:hypothetical protein
MAAFPAMRKAYMGTARKYDEILKSQLNIHAAWLPITNVFKIGDYGIVNDGVFVRAGNISSDFGVTFDQLPGPDSTINFASEGTNSYRTVDNVQVGTFPDSNIDAKLTVEFHRQSSFLLKANLAMFEMQSVNQVARALNDVSDWKRNFRVVSAIYIAKDCVIISSTGKNSMIEFSGKADALKQFDLGAIAIDISASHKKEIGLDLVGKSGVVGLTFFKLGIWSAEPKTLAQEEIEVQLCKDIKDLSDDI